MAATITETAITKAAKDAVATEKRVELIDGEHAGLRLRVTPAGAKTWVLAMRDPSGRMRRFTLGAYSKTLGLSAARKAASAMREKVRAGADPVREGQHKRATAKAAKEGIGTLLALLDLYEKKEGATLKSWCDGRRRIEGVFKPFMKRPLDALSVRDLQMKADTWPSAQSAAAAIRYIRPILKWAAKPGRGYVSRDLAELSPPASTARRERVLSREELQSLVPVLRAPGNPYAAAMALMLLTACRREEAAAARWQDVDFTNGVWTIPETKNGKPHAVPLSRQAAELLLASRPRDGENKFVTPPPEALIFPARGGGRLANFDRSTKLIMKASKTSGWTRHDLRRTAATLMGEMGEPPHIIEAALNHASVHSQLAATYNQARYRPEVCAALQRLADRIDGIAAGGGEVVPLRRS